MEDLERLSSYTWADGQTIDRRGVLGATNIKYASGGNKVKHKEAVSA
jgi:hypothetical protein